MTFQWRDLSSTTSARGPRSTPAVMSHVDGRHPKMKDETALHRWSSSQHPAPQCNREKNTRQVPTEGDSTKSLATVLKPIKGIKNKESLGTLLHSWWECKLVQSLWKTVWRFLKKLKVELPYDPAIPLLGIYPEETLISKRYMHPYVHSSTIHNSQDMLATEISIDR